MKIALGTAQWGLNYGISNSSGIPSDKELIKIFNLAHQSNILHFDTASVYGNAEKRLGDLANNKSKIITKISHNTKRYSLENQVQNSLKNLKREKIYGCLFHDSDELINNMDLWNNLLRFKESSVFEKIGFSVYEPKTLVKLIDCGLIPDIIQLPYSILDKKFEPYFPLLKQKGIEIHSRSIYLQGLYFKNTNKLPTKLKKLKPVLDYINKKCEEEDISISSLCFNFIKSNKNIDFAVIGVENHFQLLDIINFKKKNHYNKKIKNLNNAFHFDKNLLNPSNW